MSSARRAGPGGDRDMTRIFIRKRTGFLLGAALAGLIAPSVAQAEEASKSAPPAAEGGGRASAPASVIDIVVTAQRESQSLQSVPISVRDRKSTRLNSSH